MTKIRSADRERSPLPISFCMLMTMGLLSSCMGLGVGVFQASPHPEKTGDPLPAATLLEREGPPDNVVKTNENTEEWYYYNSNFGADPRFKTSLGYRWWGPYVHVACIGLPIAIPVGRTYRKYIITEGVRTSTVSTDTRLCFAGCMCLLSREESCECSMSCESPFSLFMGF